MFLVFISQGIQAFQTVVGTYFPDSLIYCFVSIVTLFFHPFANAFQCPLIFVEEHLLQGVDAPSLLVVGMEGFWGFLLTAFVALPIAYVLPGEEGQGLHEDFIDSLILWYVWKCHT